MESGPVLAVHEDDEEQEVAQPAGKKITFEDVRQAWLAIRAIDGFDSPENRQRGTPLRAFDNNMRARYCAIRLQKGLKDAVDLSDEKVRELRVPLLDNEEPPETPLFKTRKEQLEYERKERSIVMETCDIDPVPIAMRLSVIGESMKHIPADLLVNLGPFLIDDRNEADFETASGKKK